MDYSKVGSRLYSIVSKGENSSAKSIRNCTKPFFLTKEILNGCDEILLKEPGDLQIAFMGKPVNFVADSLDYIGELVQKCEGVFLLNDGKSAKNYFEKLDLDNLYQVFQKDGLQGLYTFFLNRTASGASKESFEKLNQLLINEFQKKGMKFEDLDLTLKNILKDSDFNFLPWKTKGFKMPEESPLPNWNGGWNDIESTYGLKSNSKLNKKIPDGFRLASGKVDFNHDGSINYGNSEPLSEILFLDKNNDIVLTKTVAKFKEILGRNPFLSEDEKMRTLAEYVRGVFNADAPNSIWKNFPCKPVMLGSVIESGTGCCRHKAMLSKILADETNMDMSILMGFMKKNDNDMTGAVGHVWNQLKKENGEEWLFDSTKNFFTQIVPNNPELKRYCNVDTLESFY